MTMTNKEQINVRIPMLAKTRDRVPEIVLNAGYSSKTVPPRVMHALLSPNVDEEKYI